MLCWKLLALKNGNVAVLNALFELALKPRVKKQNWKHLIFCIGFILYCCCPQPKAKVKNQPALLQRTTNEMTLFYLRSISQATAINYHTVCRIVLTSASTFNIHFSLRLPEPIEAESIFHFSAIFLVSSFIAGSVGGMIRKDYFHVE